MFGIRLQRLRLSGRGEAHALAIRARAEKRLAEEFDAAQDRGEVHGHGGDKSNVDSRNLATASDIGLRRDEIHEAARCAMPRAVMPENRPEPCALCMSWGFFGCFRAWSALFLAKPLFLIGVRVI